METFIKITADPGWSVPFYKDVDKHNYYYEIYVLVDNEKAIIFVTKEGVSVDFITSDKKMKYCIHANIIPERLFPRRKYLSWKHLAIICQTLEDIGIEGKKYSPKEVQQIYKRKKMM